MKITKYGSATVLVETTDCKILCDPWLTDGIYYGSWCNYPPINLDLCDFSNINYVYISHIHPDHFDPKTMALIPKFVPVLIHRFHRKFLKRNIEALGFKVIEIENAAPFSLTINTTITIYAADNCNPEICGKMFGCLGENLEGSLQIDSLCVIENEGYVLVNTNDCAYEIAKEALNTITARHSRIDFALIGYTSASLYPHCMMDFTEVQMKAGIEQARIKGLENGLKILKLLKPNYYMPFAGTYILGGKEAYKNENLPLPEIEDAVSYFDDQEKSIGENCKSVLLNFGKCFDLKNGLACSTYIPVDIDKRKQYITSIASKFEYSYEKEKAPSETEMLELFQQAFKRLKAKQKELFFFEDINLLFDLNESSFVCLNLMDGSCKIVSSFDTLDNYHRFKLDPRLLSLALKGPRFANWNNIEIGAHLGFSRKPDIYRMDVHVLLNSLHV